MFSLSKLLPLVNDNDKNMLVNLFKNAPSYITDQAVVKNLAPGQALLYADHKAEAIYIHITGKLAGVDTFETGVIYNFMELIPVNIIGEFEAFSGTDNYLINIRAMTHATLISIDTKDFLRWMQEDNGALYIICRLQALKLSLELKINREYLFLDSYDRLMLYLYQYCKKASSNTTITAIRKKRSEIADEIGFCVKTINRAINKLENDGLISGGRNIIEISPVQFSLIQKDLQDRGIV